MQVQRKPEIGSWTLCINPLRKSNHDKLGYFFRTTNRPSHVSHICDLCWFEIRVKNQTLPLTNHLPLNHRPDSKPEKDTL